CCERRSGASGRNDYSDFSANQLGRQLRKAVDFIIGPAVFDRHVLTLDVADIFETLSKSAQTVRKHVRRCTEEEPDHGHCRFFRPGCERPRRCRAAEQPDNLSSLEPSEMLQRCPEPGRQGSGLASIRSAIGHPTYQIVLREMDDAKLLPGVVSSCLEQLQPLSDIYRAIQPPSSFLGNKRLDVDHPKWHTPP